MEQAHVAKVISTVDEALDHGQRSIAKHQRITAGLTNDLLTRGVDSQGIIRTETTHEFKDSVIGRIPSESISRRGDWSQIAHGPQAFEPAGRVFDSPRAR